MFCKNIKCGETLESNVIKFTKKRFTIESQTMQRYFKITNILVFTETYLSNIA